MEIPYLSEEKIIKIVNNFRDKFCGDSIPVEMEDIIELKLEIVPILSPGLKNYFGIDMMIMSDFKSIYVDNNNFSDETQKNRLRFSYAHEIGHLVLHKNIYQELKIKNKDDWYIVMTKKLTPKIIKRIDLQADIFARNLLIPKKRLKLEKNKILQLPEIELLLKTKKISKEILTELLASQLSIIFGVSYMAMFVALDRL